MSHTVVGAGRSGIAAANALSARGFDTLLLEGRPGALRPEGLAPEVAFDSGHHRVREGDVAVLSPGIAEVSPVRREVAARASRVIGEIELFHELLEAQGPVPILAITGTDGKSTTTTMLGAIMQASGRPTVVGGNLGNPLTGELDAIAPGGIVVAEISCFQLTTCVHFAPQVAIVTNIAEDHTDYHGGFEAYQAAKRRIWSAMTAEGTVLLNGQDPFIETWIARGLGPARPRLRYFSLDDPSHAAFARDGQLFCTPPGDDAPRPFMTRAELPLLGTHNVLNALAAAQAACEAGATPAQCREALMAYAPLPHRLRPVTTRDGITWVNDSKATNPNAAMAGINAIEGPLIALVGGSSKEADFTALAATLQARARAVICFGQTRETLSEAVAHHPDRRVVPTLEEAVALAATIALPGDTVLLSPACASFDAFRGYDHRGEVFEALVRQG